MSRNIKMVVAYEGTHYAGFQRQAGGVKTIQGALEEAIAQITGSMPNVIGAGRTDAGVHALGQVVHFHSETRLKEGQLLNALNAVLPRDIVICEVSEVPAEFHSRYSALSKTYSYRIWNDPVRPVFHREWLYHYKYPLDTAVMREAASFIVGQHDFKSFQASGSSVKTTVRTVHFCELMSEGPEITIRINADGFLYHMVRNIVGTLILVGTGRMSLAGFKAVLAACDRNAAGPTAPASGLCLEEVFYPEMKPEI
ncbi:MAG TPA: tRNA pseudouridine(38-40) synthase TruA [Bacillota bacterium]|nr:tRNA pseudouridine(38-40) synthase TruA [Bacillota bacterium]HPT87536.1 tRNA pseudouridine(38-40) synthase TruA [Bacillota bacterium]